jgi:hypothetical protein
MFICHQALDPGPDPQMIKVLVGEEDNFDLYYITNLEDVPLSQRLRMSRAGDTEVAAVPAISHSTPGRNLTRRMKDTEVYQHVTQASIIPRR